MTTIDLQCDICLTIDPYLAPELAGSVCRRRGCGGIMRTSNTFPFTRATPATLAVACIDDFVRKYGTHTPALLIDLAAEGRNDALGEMLNEMARDLRAALENEAKGTR